VPFLTLDDVSSFPFLPQEIIGGIHGDFVDLTFEASPFFEPIEIFVDLDQSFLADFLGLFEISRHSVRHVQKTLAMRPEKPLEGGLVSFEDFSNQIIIILHPH